MNRAKGPDQRVQLLKNVSGTFAVQGIEKFDVSLQAFSPVHFALKTSINYLL
jgi:hypothetical protein